MGETSKELGEFKGISEKARLLAEVIASDETGEIKKRIEEQYNRLYGNPAMVDEGKKSSKQQSKDGKKKDDDSVDPETVDYITKELSGVKVEQRERIVRDWEKEVGIANLPDDKKSEIRKNIAGYLSTFDKGS